MNTTTPARKKILESPNKLVRCAGDQEDEKTVPDIVGNTGGERSKNAKVRKRLNFKGYFI